jgi:4-diphosphocytidyl-2-C-methyl-D-erythritol kinase
MNSIVLSSPAKLNLYLKVLNKRTDGFHNITTVFERISLCDELYFRSNQKGNIRILCDHPHVPTGSKNFVYKAARLFQKELGIRQGVQISIKKRIPVAAGLAGGSSNAATALVGLNKVWKLNLTYSQLLSYARRLGSDVSFFLHDCRWALGTERGDKIKQLDIPKSLWHIIVVPRIRMYSWKVYGGLKLPIGRPQRAAEGVSGGKDGVLSAMRGGTNVLTKKSDDVNIFIHHLQNNNICEMEKRMVNDLEGSIIHLCRRLEKVKQKLKSLGAQGVMISGSGPAVFGIASNQKEAQQMRLILSRRFSQVFVVRTF